MESARLCRSECLLLTGDEHVVIYTVAWLLRYTLRTKVSVLINMGGLKAYRSIRSDN